jgi:hypothetical protein
MSIRIDKAVACSKGPQPGTRCLLDELLRRYPGSRDMGIYNCRDVRGATTPSIHGEGRAGDIGPADKKQGDEIATWLISNARAYQIQRIIWYRRIWDYAKGWREYTGLHPHTDHVHFEQNWDGAKKCGRAGFGLMTAGMSWWQYAVLVSVAAGAMYQAYRKRKR